MSAFIRSKNDYDACVQLIETEFKAQIHAHWTEYSLFKRKYQNCSHRYVVNELKKQVTYCKPIQIEDDEEYSPPSYVSRALSAVIWWRVEDTMMSTAKRHEVWKCQQNLRVLQNKRAEECRGNGKYLDSTTRAVEAHAMCDVDRATERAVQSLKRRGGSCDFSAA